MAATGLELLSLNCGSTPVVLRVWQAMMKAGQLALSNRAPRPQPPHTHLKGTYFKLLLPAYGLVCGDPNYGWLPYSTFPSAPPASSVYMTDALHLPGLIPNTPMLTSRDAATQQMPAAYYDPNKPNTAYAAASAPPAYEEANLYEKKRL
ncbi:hypothetical protein EB796_017783 [Bugula neritina]|uniref:Uncharacterized protein n=1 Tax=Bugula neritina TaxID=10212 RepID=A0A7J7JEV4_BUGNE|nr:hypothetical protein EB796_017783 [Bugula neritina]